MKEKEKSSQAFAMEQLQKDAKKEWSYTLLPDFKCIFRSDSKSNNLYQDLFVNGFCILASNAHIFELLLMNIKAIKRVHNVAQRPANLHSEMEPAGAIFDVPGSEERKPRRMAKFRGGHSEAAVAVKERYPNTTDILSIVKHQILAQFVPTSTINILCRYTLLFHLDWIFMTTHRSPTEMTPLILLSTIIH